MQRNKVTQRESLYIRMLHVEESMSIPDIVKKFPQYSRATVYRHAKKPLAVKRDRRHDNKGRPSKVTAQDERQIIRKIQQLREEVGSFTLKRLRLEAGVAHISIHTVRRVMIDNGYHYMQSRKKGLLKKSDCNLRTNFARNVIRNKPNDFWTNNIGMYLDGTSFAYKTNPHDQARAPRSMAWRRRSEGLDLRCTAKGRKTGTGGKTAAFMVGISYKSGVILCEQYAGKLNGESFARMIRKSFPAALKKATNKGKLILQDGCPVQNSAAAKRAFKRIRAEIYPIPPRSPDINVIENFFKMMEARLREDALEQKITKETYEEFCERVKNTILNMPRDYIDKTIESLSKRMQEVVKRKGQRTKY